MKKLIVFLIVFLFLASFVSACAPSSETPTQEKPTPTSDPSFYLDSDGDGMNDWFETNIAHYDPNVPNDRYVILFFKMLDQPGLEPYDIDQPAQFFINQGKIPPANIIRLSQEGANADTLKNAIEQIAIKSDENDIVFLKIDAHGYTIASFSSGDENISTGADMVEGYRMIDEWLDEINAKAVIVTVMACGADEFDFPLNDGTCPRIVFTYAAGEFIGGLGEYPEYFTTADTKYGNGDGYISLGEIANWLDNDPMWGPDWGNYTTMEERYKYGRSHLEAYGYSKMSDTSNIASQIYLTDCYHKPLSAKNS